MYSSREPCMLCCEITRAYLPYYLSICWDALVEQMRANTHLPAANSTCYWIAADGAAVPPRSLPIFPHKLSSDPPHFSRLHISLSLKCIVRHFLPYHSSYQRWTSSVVAHITKYIILYLGVRLYFACKD